MSETVEQWAMRRNRDSGRCAGIMEAYDVLRERLDETDRKILLDMARDALIGNQQEQ
jgi:phage anti-repressor protein